MFNIKRCAKVNVKVLLVLILVTSALLISLFAARQIRRNILSKMDLEAGLAAYEIEDWQQASKYFREYLGRNPDDIEILKKYANAAISIRPLDSADISGALSAYRRVLQLDPLDEEAYEKLAMLYTSIGNPEELAYIARSRLEVEPEDFNAPLWLGDALTSLNRMNEAKQVLEEFILKLEPLSQKHIEYVRACLLMSRIAKQGTAAGSQTEALEWLNKAVEYDSDCVESLVSRAGFYLEIVELSLLYGGVSPITNITLDNMLVLAREDLEAADKLTIEDPRIRLLLGNEWIYLGDYNRAAAELEAADNLSRETIEKYFFDFNDWKVKRFVLAAKLALQKNDPVACQSLADETLSELVEKSHKIQALPEAIKLYLAAGNISLAREYLDEYLENQYTPAGSSITKLELAYLKAIVARAEERPYAVIDVLRTVLVSNVTRPDLWLLLADAYSSTDQTRLAINALIKYLLIRPRDPEVTLQLAREYLKLQDWNKAFETARLAEPLNPTDIIIKLLRIEASIYIAAEVNYEIDATRLEALSAELAQLRQENPDRVDIRILQAIIAVYLERPDEAERELKLAIEECEEPLRAEMQLARHYYRTDRISEAISTCRTACERQPELAEPWLSLAGLYVSDEEYESARDCLLEGLERTTSRLEKRSLSIRLGLVEVLYLDRANGIQILSELASQDDQEVRARELLLGITEVQQDRERAQQLIEELKAAEGESGLFWRLYEAALWLSSDDWRSKQQDISDHLKYCIDLDPEWSTPVLLMASMYEKLQDTVRYEDILRQALARNPEATDVADALITLYEKQNRFLDAENVLNQVETNQRVTSTWQTRLALSSGDFSRAIAELKLLVSNDDQDANSKILLARLLYWQGDTETAFNYLKEAEEIMPDSMAFTAAKVSILRAEGNTEEAQQILDDYVEKNSTFNAYAMRAAYLTQQGELERAEQDYIKLTSFADEGATGYQLLSNFYGSTGDYDKAISTLEKGINTYDENLNIKRRLMTTLLLTGQADDRQKAYDILSTLEQKLPQDPELMKLRAYQILEDPTPEAIISAKEIMENVVELEPTAVDAHLILIRIATQQGQYEDARNLAIRALGSNQDNIELLSARAIAELALENTQMATQLAQLVLRTDPNNIQARDIIVEAAIKTEAPSLLNEARTLIETQLRKDSENESLLISLTRVLVSMDVPQEAIPEIEAYCQTEKGKNSIVGLVTLADLYRLINDMEQAEYWINQAKQIDPDNLNVIHARFLWLVAQNREDELTEISSEYLSAKEQNVTTLNAAASLLAASDSMVLKNEGLKLFEQAVRLSSTSKNACIGLASTLYQTGNAERAIEEYQKLLEQYPNDKQVLNDLAWILQEHDQRYDEALELANRGLKIEPDELHLLDTRGAILANMGGHLEDAMNDYKKLIELASPDTRQRAKAQLELGRICVKLNDFVQARQYLQDAMEIDEKIGVFSDDERSEIKGMLQEEGLQALNY